MYDWVTSLRDSVDREPAAMISILASEGSAPRGAGTRMVVTAGGTQGTIGGGQLEFRAVEQALAILRLAPGSWRIQDYPLGPLLGQCCGGRVRLLVEHIDPAGLAWLTDATDGQRVVSKLMVDRVERRICAETLPTLLPARGDLPQEGDSFCETIGPRRRPLYLFGAGHVGQAIARHAQGLPFQLAWFDTRPDFEAVEGAVIVPESEIEHCVSQAPEEAAIIILTHDHGLDFRLTYASLTREPVAFVGLIGSATKKARFLSRLEREGVASEARARLTSPIGIGGISGKEPDIIAIATLAQLLQLGLPHQF
ncbi:xanthine dehydrogenase accessory protein XdhC [Sphingobium boeckii]|uniref:Xanthine dehydrogenase accessory factor n=1 Tax=Sphingobium boeckii TaxID=1082345 RepID=A0A7W9EE11_9SPHN|nr:xanthine dehydrogenase accessory protein XdhC [Sphingobium boeckii]MBB5685712.1 xanthine dehydrogenase accessory factor [Sphingobium boeckii]